MRRWKLSPMDLESISRWEDYSRAKDEMFVHTDIPEAPWYVVESEDKRRARINMIAHLLSTIPYARVPNAAADAAAPAAVERVSEDPAGDADVRAGPCRDRRPPRDGAIAQMWRPGRRAPTPRPPRARRRPR